MLASNSFWAVDASFVIALIALFYTVSEIRRNNNIVLSIRECGCSTRQSLDENKGKLFTHFKLTLQNKGINLHSLTLCLVFNLEKGGTVSCPLTQKNHLDVPINSFSKGMITTFYFKTHELTKEQLHFLSMLENPRKQDACLCLYSQTYLAKTFFVNSLSDRLKQLWNRLAWRLSVRIKKGTNNEGADIVRYYRLPTFQTYGDKIDLFVDYLRTIGGSYENFEGTANDA